MQVVSGWKISRYFLNQSEVKTFHDLLTRFPALAPSCFDRWFFHLLGTFVMESFTIIIIFFMQAKFRELEGDNSRKIRANLDVLWKGHRNNTEDLPKASKRSTGSLGPTANCWQNSLGPTNVPADSRTNGDVSEVSYNSSNAWSEENN